MEPVDRTPTDSTDYAALSVVYGTLLAGTAASARRREPVPAGELAPLAAATFALSKLLVKEKAETWLRQPFVDEEARRPKGRGLRYALGELLTCTRCMGAWSALGLVALRVHAPAAGRAVTGVLATSAGNDFLHAAFARVCAPRRSPDVSSSQPPNSGQRHGYPRERPGYQDARLMGSSNAQQQLRAVEVLPHHAAPQTDVRLTLPARPENVAVVRHVLGAFAQALQLSPDLIEDLRLAITEACTNVVRHAYADGDPGAVEISIEPKEDLVHVVVADRGRGIGTSADTSGPGLGLPLIAAIADTVDLQSAPGGGSRVAMTFVRRGPGEAA